MANTAGEREEQCILADKNKKNCDRRIKPNMTLQAISDTLSIIPGSDDIDQIVEATVTELESVVVVPINSEPSQGSIDGGPEINIDQAGENVPNHERAMKVIVRAILIVGMLTVIVDGRTALYKSASGLVFGHNKLAYNVTLAVIFIFGVVELFTGLSISISELAYRRRLWIGATFLFLSIWPLLGILSISGFA